MIKLMNFADLIAYGSSLYVLAHGDGIGYLIFFGIGLAISFIKKIFK